MQVTQVQTTNEWLAGWSFAAFRSG